MKLFFLSTSSVLAVALAPQSGAPSPQVVRVPTRWSAGSKWVYERTKERVDVRNGEPRSAGRGIVPIEVEVLESGEGASALRWTYGKLKLESMPSLAGAPAEVKEALSKLQDLSSGLAMEFNTDSGGVPVSVRNAKPLFDKAMEAFDAAMTQLKAAGMPEAQLQALGGSARQSLTADLFASSMIREPRILHYFCGRTVSVGGAEESDSEIGSPLGTGTLKARLRLAGEPVEGAPNEVRIQFQLRIDPASAKAVVEDIFARANSRGGAPTSLPADAPPIELSDRGTARLDLTTGLPIEIEHTRTFEMLGQKRIDKIQFRRLEGAASKPAKKE
ncbi:MAG: hypothetical protein JNJ88_14360 [Planctomycetes bacterium]|nr:hypothetical protein [Planctomycetota bacterium]